MKQDKLMPQNIELERMVIATLIVNSGALDDVISILSEKVFYKESNSLIFKAINDLYINGNPIDLVTVTVQLRKNGDLERAGGAYEVTILTNTQTNVSSLSYYSLIIYDLYLKRELIHISSKLGEAMYSDTSETIKEINNLQSKLVEIQGKIQGITSKVESVGDITESYINYIKEIQEKGTPPQGISLGIMEIDVTLKGAKPGKLIILAARPGIGKTAVALNFLQSFIKDGHSGIYFSLEMGKDELINRVIASETCIKMDDLDSGKLTPIEMIRAERFNRIYRDSKVYINDNSRIDYKNIKSEVVKHISEHKSIDFVIIDYLQLMETDESSGSNKTNEVGKITRELKLLSKEYKIPVILLSQLSRSVESRQDKRPIESDLRDSGSIEQDADIIAFLFSPSKYYTYSQVDEDVLESLNIETEQHFNTYLEFIVRKNRGGEAPKYIQLDFYKDVGRVQANYQGRGPIMRSEYSDSGNEHFIEPFNHNEGDKF